MIELIKCRVGDLHQINKIYSKEISEEYEPEEEGQENTFVKRRVTCLDCILSKDPLDTTDVGYQEPIEKVAFFENVID